MSKNITQYNIGTSDNNVTTNINGTANTQSLIPLADNTYDIGSNDNKYKDIYGATFLGNAATATQFSSTRTIGLTGDIEGEAESTGLNGWSIPTTIKNGAVTAEKVSANFISELGLGSALKFIGSTTDNISDGNTELTTITVNGEDHEANIGDVVLKDNDEFVWTGSAWEWLGPDLTIATETAAGLMSADDKKKLNDLNNTITSTAQSVLGAVILTEVVDGTDTGGITGAFDGQLGIVLQGGNS